MQFQNCSRYILIDRLFNETLENLSLFTAVYNHDKSSDTHQTLWTHCIGVWLGRTIFVCRIQLLLVCIQESVCQAVKWCTPWAVATEMTIPSKSDNHYVNTTCTSHLFIIFRIVFTRQMMYSFIFDFCRSKDHLLHIIPVRTILIAIIWIFIKQPVLYILVFSLAFDCRHHHLIHLFRASSGSQRDVDLLILHHLTKDNLHRTLTHFFCCFFNDQFHNTSLSCSFCNRAHHFCIHGK